MRTRAIVAAALAVAVTSDVAPLVGERLEEALFDVARLGRGPDDVLFDLNK